MPTLKTSYIMYEVFSCFLLIVCDILLCGESMKRILMRVKGVIKRTIKNYGKQRDDVGGKNNIENLTEVSCIFIRRLLLLIKKTEINIMLCRSIIM